MNRLWGSSVEERRILLAGLCVGLVPLVSFGLATPVNSLSALIVGYGLATVPFLYVCRGWRRLGDNNTALVRVLIVALACRLVLLTVPPLLSEDLWRYVWDGMHIWGGLSPYGVAPSDASQDLFSAQYGLNLVRSQIGHSEIPTIYPPTAQLTFALATAFGPQGLAIRLTMIFADLITITALWVWAKASDRPPQLAALFAFAPLAVVESSIGAHVDSVGIAALVTAGALYMRRSTIGAGLAITWSIGIKLVPAFVLLHWLRRRPRYAIAAIALTVIVFAAFMTLCSVDYSGLRTFAHRWRANDGLFAVLYSAFEQLWPNDGQFIELAPRVAEGVRVLVGGAGIEGRVWPDELVFACTKITAAVAIGACLLAATVRAGSMETFWVWVMGALLLLSPVVHPWYLLWVLPFAALLVADDRCRWGHVFFLWSLLIWLAYLPRAEYLESGRWLEAAWSRPLQYLPVWGFVVYAVLRGRRSLSANEAGTQ